MSTVEEVLKHSSSAVQFMACVERIAARLAEQHYHLFGVLIVENEQNSETVMH